MKFPEEVPVLNFVSEDNCEIFPEWEKLHRSVMGDNQEKKLVCKEMGIKSVHIMLWLQQRWL